MQKQARQLNMEANSQSFIDAIRCFYMPRLVQKIEQNSIDHHTTAMNTDQVSHIIPSSNKDTSCSNTSLEFQDQLTNSKDGSSIVLDDINSVNSCNYDMDLGSMSASDMLFSGCHVEGNDWLANDMAEDGMWVLDELWQFRK